MGDKENVLNTFGSNSNNLEVVQAKYEVSSPSITFRALKLLEKESPIDILVYFVGILIEKLSLPSQCHTQNFLTELASGRKQLDDITKLGEELVKKQHSKKKEIQLRLGIVTRRYEG